MSDFPPIIVIAPPEPEEVRKMDIETLSFWLGVYSHMLQNPKYHAVIKNVGD